MRYTIFIPSKGRAENQRTVKMLYENGIKNFFVVVENDDYPQYLACNYLSHKQILRMPKSNYGTSTNARNFCLDYAKKEKMEKIWMLDDDISHIYTHTKGKRCIGVSVQECFERIENFVARDPKIKVVGMRTSASFLKDVKKDLQFNCSLTSIYLLSVDKFRFRGTMLVDMDYQLQVLRKGFKTLRMENYAFTFITPTKALGGYYDIYTNDERRLAAIKEFCKLNPDVDPTVKRNTTGFYVLANISKIWRKFK